MHKVYHSSNYDTIKNMTIYERILNLVFKESFPKKILDSLHPAPPHRENFIFSVFDYHQTHTKELIRYLKNHKDFLLKKDLSRYMSEHILDYLSDQQELSYFENPLVIPVPISRKRLRERGFNQTHLLAKYIAKKIGGEYQKNIIKKYRANKKQALIHSRAERFRNVENVFKIISNKKYSIENRDVIIIDDLTTTGATLLEMKKTLKKSGARNVIAITIAH